MLDSGEDLVDSILESGEDTCVESVIVIKHAGSHLEEQVPPQLQPLPCSLALRQHQNILSRDSEHSEKVFLLLLFSS